MIKVVALDVDGVLIDSAHECYFVLTKILDKFFDLEINDELEKKYNKGRPFLKAAGDFFVIFKLIEQGIDFDSINQEYFDKERKKYPEEPKEEAVAFFRAREDLQKQDFEKWFSLNKAYPNIVESVKNLSRHYKIAIASNKDLESIQIMIEKFGLDIKEENIISKEIVLNKFEQLKIISKKFSVAPEEILFIDDMIEQLKNVKKLGVKTALAKWGYNNKRQLEEARQLGIAIIEKPEDITKYIKELEKE